jgi:hypothetical protein
MRCVVRSWTFGCSLTCLSLFALTGCIPPNAGEKSGANTNSSTSTDNASRALANSSVSGWNTTTPGGGGGSVLEWDFPTESADDIESEEDGWTFPTEADSEDDGFTFPAESDDSESEDDGFTFPVETEKTTVEEEKVEKVPAESIDEKKKPLTSSSS